MYCDSFGKGAALVAHPEALLRAVLGFSPTILCVYMLTGAYVATGTFGCVAEDVGTVVGAATAAAVAGHSLHRVRWIISCE